MVGVVDTQCTEAVVDFGVGVFTGNFVTSPADAFAGDFRDGFVASFKGFGLFVGLLRKLYHDPFAIAAVFGVELHDGVSGCG